MNQQSQNYQSSSKHLSRTPLQSKMNKSENNELPNTKIIPKLPELFKSKSKQIQSQSKITSLSQTDKQIDNENFPYNKDMICSNDTCVHLYSPQKEIHLSLTPPIISSPIFIHNNIINLNQSPLPIKQLTYITSEDLDIMRKYDSYVNEEIEYDI